QPLERLHRGVGERLEDLPHQLDALVKREKWRLLRVVADADDEAVEQPAAARGDVEGAGVNGGGRARGDGETGTQCRSHEAPHVATTGRRGLYEPRRRLRRKK